MRASGSAMRRPWSRMGIPKYAGVGENKTRPQTLHVPKIRQRAPFPHAAKNTTVIQIFMHLGNICGQHLL